MAWPASGARVGPIRATGIDETGEHQPSRRLSGSAGAGSAPDAPDEEGAGAAGLPGPPPGPGPSPRAPWPHCFWGDMPDEQARGSLRHALYELRKALAASARRPSYRRRHRDRQRRHHRSRRGGLHAAPGRGHARGARGGRGAVPRRPAGGIERQGGAVGDVAEGASESDCASRPGTAWPGCWPTSGRRTSSRPRSGPRTSCSRSIACRSRCTARSCACTRSSGSGARRSASISTA